ncbi:hypothetical protein [Myxosarcina sp. GI1]|uniref:hypothetical protein n=1 Tax=Myxosarcina sp. GI1 TaxID=1541065 RepID=UPI00068B6154|nr:hypothetical protein [Myxosarcina sp. GI1]
MLKFLCGAITSIVLVAGLPHGSLASETIAVDREFALKREIEIDVTPSGIVLQFNSPINAVNLSHLGEIVFQGVDGELCELSTSCTAETAPTMLLLKKIPKIDFPDLEPTTDGTAMLYVDTASGLYRFELTPKSQKPEYTKVEINDEPMSPLFESKKP